jgi:hypothetical protein
MVMMALLSGFAIIPDDAVEPVAVFFDLADAVDWALATLGSDRFRIRGVALRTANTDTNRPAA